MPKPFALIIEDDQSLAELFEIVVNDEGYDSEKIYHGQDALDRLAETTPDIILLDLSLPAVSGNTILKKIRSDGRFKDTRVVIVTGHHQSAAGNTGTLATTTLVKPINIDLLRLLIKRFNN